MNRDELIRALQNPAIRDDDTLLKNEVGNLAVFDADGYFVGYVDLLTGEVDIFARQ